MRWHASSSLLAALLCAPLAAQGNIPLELGGECGANQQPQMVFVEPPGSFPRIGHDNPTAIVLCPPCAAVQVQFGFNTSTWNGQMPPFYLDPIYGTVGCVMWVAPVTNQSLAADASGVASFSWPVPNDPSLAGINVRLQAIVIDQSAPGGFTLSNCFQVNL